jgi:hypothetical protein
MPIKYVGLPLKLVEETGKIIAPVEARKIQKALEKLA